MKAMDLLQALEQVPEEYLRETEQCRGTRRRGPARPLRLLLVAAIVVGLLTCGYVASQKWLAEGWYFQQSPDPEETARTALENQIATGALVVEIQSVKIDPEETARVVELYTDSELAQSRGWSRELLRDHFVVVETIYYAEYDHSRTFLRDGRSRVWFWLLRDPETGRWSVVDSTSPEDLP